MYSQESGKNASGEGDLAVKAIVPEKVQHDAKEQIAIIFNHRLNVKSKDSFVVDFVGSAGRVQVPARLVNSSTLMLETPGYREPSVVTAYVYQGVHRRLLGEHTFEFLSRNDTFYRLLYGALDPINFMCEALKISPADIHDLDAALAETFKTKAPEGFEFIGTCTEGTGTSDAEHPTLLHFACEFGLTQLIRVLLRYPGAREACSMKNCHDLRPYNIAENHGFDQLANELRAFHDRGDQDPYITMGEKDEDLYVKMQKEDGSYYYVLKKGGNLYADVDGNEENEDNEYYVKMAKEDGGYYYMPMKEGVGRKQYGKANKQGYINVAGHNEPHDDEAIYANLGPEELSSGNDDQDGQELYEDMDHNRNPADDEQLYVKMEQDGNPRNLSPGDSGHDEQFYEDMNPEGNDVIEEVYTDMQPAATDDYTDLYIAMDQGLEQTPDSFGYVKPTSNRPVNQDAVLFNRSASSAAAIRAKQLENERKTQSLPAGTSQADVMKRVIEQNVKSGKLTDEVASQMMEQLGLSPPSEVMPRRGSTASKASSSTTSSTGTTGSTGSSGISLASDPELWQHHQESVGVAEDEEEIHVSRDEIISQLRKSKGVNDAPPPVPQPDYCQKDKSPGRPRKSHSRSKTSPVEEKDIRGILNKATAPQPPPIVKRRQSSPLTGTVTASQPMDAQPIPEFAQPPKTTPRPAARKPIPTPSSDTSRPGSGVAPSERLPAAIRQSGVPVFPFPSVKESAPQQPLPPPRNKAPPPSPKQY